MTIRIIIGNKAYSSWSMRGWLALKQSGLPFEEDVVFLYGESWETRCKAADLAPSRGKVPMLWDGDIPVWESLAILDYLADKVGADRFWPADPAARALARSIAAEMHAGYQALRSNHCTNYRKVYASEPLLPEVEADIARIESLWREARTRFGAGGDFLFGAFGAADIMFAPVISRFHTYTLPLAEDLIGYRDATLAHPFVREWYDGAASETWVIPKFER